ncbi:hypothetical protein Rin_00006820, partial [Candidatus Regiella insecticola 5.15]
QGCQLKGSKKGEAEHEAKPIDIKSLMP